MANTTGVISGSIKWTGLASGTDFASVVDKLVAIESRTITRQETWKAEWQAKMQAISDLNTRLVSLKLDAQSKDIRSELLSRKTTVSNESVMTVVNTSTAPLGSYEVSVGTNIPEKIASRSFADTQIFGAAGDTLTIQVGSDPANFITLTATASATPAANEFTIGSTMEQLKDAINTAAAAAVPPVALTAEIKLDRLNAGVQNQRLVLTATDGGSANRITLTGSITDLNLGSTYIDKPVYTTFLGSNAVVSVIDPDSAYKGNINKTVTFVPLNSGVLGTDDVQIQWADTEGNSGKFTIAAADYTPTKEYDVIQGLKLTFQDPDLVTEGRFIQNESFTIDLQAPELQKGQDSGLAQTAKVVHSGFADQISPIHEGTAATFTYIYKGIEHSVTVTDKMSLGTLASTINSDATNPGVTASIVNDGQGTSSSYHLVLTGNHSGAEATLSVKDNTGDPDAMLYFSTSPLSFTLAREAANSMFKVDGFPAGNDNWIQRRSNEVSDVIEGVVMTLNSVGESTLTVNNDPTAIRDKIVQLVQSVNFCKTYILENTKWGGSNLEVGMTDSGDVTTTRETANGLMIGNYGFQIAQTKLDAFMHTSLVPFSENPALDTKARIEKRQKYLDDNGLIYTTLAEIGIGSDPDNQGLYTVKEAELLECIQKNPEAVLKLFTFSDEYTDVNKEGKTVTINIRGAALSLAEEMTKLTSTTDVTDANGNVTQKGKGIMVTLQENYQGIIDNIDAKIAREERRIETVRQRYTDRFNRLETALQQLEDKQSQLEASLQSLNNDSSS
jgi:flagellar hook-associated protein 2